MSNPEAEQRDVPLNTMCVCRSLTAAWVPTHKSSSPAGQRPPARTAKTGKTVHKLLTLLNNKTLSVSLAMYFYMFYFEIPEFLLSRSVDEPWSLVCHTVGGKRHGKFAAVKLERRLNYILLV